MVGYIGINLYLSKALVLERIVDLILKQTKGCIFSNKT